MDIFSVFRKSEEREALIAPGEDAITYGKLQRYMSTFREIVLSECGDMSHVLCFCMCRNRPGAVIGYLGMLYSGMVPLLLDAALQDEPFSQFYRTYRPAFVWAEDEWAEEHSGICKNVICRAEGFGLWSTGEVYLRCNDKLGLLLATSGSTGTPKLVRLSPENLRSNASSICEYLGLDETERPITTLPMQYTYGLSVINSHLFAGGCILMTTSGYVQSAFWEFLESQRATSFGGVPYTYEILKRIHIFQKEIPSLRSITQAGGHLSASLQEEVGNWAYKQGIRFYIMYGQTEATARMSYLPPEYCLSKIGSIGIPVPGGRFELQDENGKRITEPDCTGELFYYGPNVSLGYAVCREDLAKGDERGGCLPTGDMARRDADGYYFITGRKKRFVKLYGVRVSLDACEEILKEKYPEKELVCAGTDDRLTIYSTDEGAGESAMQTLSEYLHINRKAFCAVTVEKIPKNASGKTMYGKLPQK